MRTAVTYNPVLGILIVTLLTGCQSGATIVSTAQASLHPEVLASFPPDGARGVPVGSDIRIRFSSPMDRDIAAQALAISPRTDYEILWEDEGQQMVIHSLKGWDPFTRYEVTVTSEAKSEAGVHLEKDYSLLFATEGTPPIVLSAALPVGDAGSLQSDIRIKFSKPMDTFATEEALTVSPEVEYKVLWEEDGQSMVISPLKGWEVLTRYEIALTSETKSRDGCYMEHKYTVSFIIEGTPPIVLSTDLPVDAAGASLHTDIRIVFSSPMDKGATTKALIIFPEIPHRVMWENDNRVMVIHPLANWQILVDYEVTVTGAAKSEDGFYMEKDYSFSFQLRERPQPPIVVSTNPKANEDDVYPEALIRILFSKPMDREATERALVIIPDTDLHLGVAIRWEEGDRLMVIYLAQSMRPGEEYIITITREAMSQDGLYMEVDYTLKFGIEPC